MNRNQAARTLQFSTPGLLQSPPVSLGSLQCYSTPCQIFYAVLGNANIVFHSNAATGIE
jgi:hypothetical protein